jgi:hypothetical protein
MADRRMMISAVNLSQGQQVNDYSIGPIGASEGLWKNRPSTAEWVPMSWLY